MPCLTLGALRPHAASEPLRLENFDRSLPLAGRESCLRTARRAAHLAAPVWITHPRQGFSHGSAARAGPALLRSSADLPATKRSPQCLLNADLISLREQRGDGAPGLECLAARSCGGTMLRMLEAGHVGQLRSSTTQPAASPDPAWGSSRETDLQPCWSSLSCRQASSDLARSAHFEAAASSPAARGCQVLPTHLGQHRASDARRDSTLHALLPFRVLNLLRPATLAAKP